ncbi:MAG: alpha/beta hydrolase, partial [Terriglobia bacterium]
RHSVQLRRREEMLMMTILWRLGRIALTAVVLPIAAALAFASGAAAQGRTLVQLKAEVQARADRNAYPVNGLKPDEVREALSRIHHLNDGEWAAAWSTLGDRYMAKAQAELASSPEQADKDFVQAWRYYDFGRWPAAFTPAKKKAYEKGLEAYRAHARLLHPPLDVLHIPFEGNEIVAYLQLPARPKPAPVVIVMAGLDQRKEQMAERFRLLLNDGVGYLAVDSPGTGQAPIKAAPGAERMLSRVIGYLYQRPDIDHRHIVAYGASYGGYWSTVLAFTEKNRLCGVVSQSPPVDAFFQRASTMEIPHNREYLFDYLPAHLRMFGVQNIDQLADVQEKMSLKARGLLGRPSAPMLVIAGALDTQVPISDTDLLLNSGQTPKDAWINPQGGHMGRQTNVWSGARIFKLVTIPWILRKVGTWK